MSSSPASKRLRGVTSEDESDTISTSDSSDDGGILSDEETDDDLRKKLVDEKATNMTLVAKVAELNKKIDSLDTTVFNLEGKNERQANLIQSLREEELKREKIDGIEQKLTNIEFMLKDMPKSTDFFTVMGGQLLTAIASLFEASDDNDVIDSFTADVRYAGGDSYGKLVNI